MSLPICCFVRCNGLKNNETRFRFSTTKGYSAMNKSHYFGYKLYMVVSSNSVFKNSSIIQANAHHVKTLDDVIKGFLENVKLLGDKGYVGKTSN